MARCQQEKAANHNDAREVICMRPDFELLQAAYGFNVSNIHALKELSRLWKGTAKG